MKQTERASLMRIVSDMVKADAIIDMQEMEFLNDIRLKYNIRQDDEQIADTFTLADAFQILQKSPKSLKQDIWSVFKGVALSDNICSREEAMYLLSIVVCLSDQKFDHSKVYSVELTENMKIDCSQVLYIEGEYYKDTNREITEHYREIMNELRLIGFNFIYIPKVGEHYKSLSNEEIQTLITFLYPSVTDYHQIVNIANQITTLATSDFCKAEIVGRMKIDGLAHSLPSLMFRIGQTSSNGKDFDNFLVLNIEEEDALIAVRRIVDSFVSMFRPRILNPIYEEKKRFVYHGFYKQILDSLVYKKGIRSSVVVDLIQREILLPEANSKISGLHRREKALYALFLLESSSGGINFNKPTGMKMFDKYKHRMGIIQQKYELIYEAFGGIRTDAPQLELPTNRNPMISFIKGQLRQLGDLLNQPDDYLVQRNMFGNYCVTIPPELCLCTDIETDRICRFEESDFWRKLMAM
ncbi:MAG: hypothetical protein IKH26_09580 [Bacteroidaceae bacterium]|nr:hypothetical protein [Bacteroidaceae bacterium]